MPFNKIDNPKIQKTPYILNGTSFYISGQLKSEYFAEQFGSM